MRPKRAIQLPTCNFRGPWGRVIWAMGETGFWSTYCTESQLKSLNRRLLKSDSSNMSVWSTVWLKPCKNQTDFGKCHEKRMHTCLYIYTHETTIECTVRPHPSIIWHESSHLVVQLLNILNLHLNSWTSPGQISSLWNYPSSTNQHSLPKSCTSSHNSQHLILHPTKKHSISPSLIDDSSLHLRATRSENLIHLDFFTHLPMRRFLLAQGPPRAK